MVTNLEHRHAQENSDMKSVVFLIFFLWQTINMLLLQQLQCKAKDINQVFPSTMPNFCAGFLLFLSFENDFTPFFKIYGSHCFILPLSHHAYRFSPRGPLDLVRLPYSPTRVCTGSFLVQQTIWNLKSCNLSLIFCFMICNGFSI